jgi:hypothetical protein
VEGYGQFVVIRSQYSEDGRLMEIYVISSENHYRRENHV